jgi:hypothetical protein
MTGPSYRLGDLIDDYCLRCRLLLNHAVASLMGDKVAKVICQTCYTEHPYRHGEGGKKKTKPSDRTALFGQVLSKVQSQPATPGAPPTDPPEDASAAPKKKRPEVLPRYITRHRTKPPRKNR